MSLTGCINVSESEQSKIDAFLSEHSSSFEDRVKVVYGGDSILTGTRVETTLQLNETSLAFDRLASETLSGIVSLDGANFIVRYDPVEDVILTSRNFSKIEDSIEPILGIDNIEIIDTTLFSKELTTWMLPEEVQSIEEVIKRGYYAQMRVYTLNDITPLEIEHFDRLIETWSGSLESAGDFVLLQVRSEQDIRRMKSSVKDMDFSHVTLPRLYDSNLHSYVNSFDKYGIVASIYLSYENGEVLFNKLTCDEEWEK